MTAVISQISELDWIDKPAAWRRVPGLGGVSESIVQNIPNTTSYVFYAVKVHWGLVLA